MASGFGAWGIVYGYTLGGCGFLGVGFLGLGWCGHSPALGGCGGPKYRGPSLRSG